MKPTRLPWIVLALSAICTVLAWHMLREAATEQARTRFDAQMQRAQSDIEHRMLAYEQVLHAAAGLFARPHEISRAEWRAYVADLKLNQHYPGILAIGYAEALTQRDLAHHLAGVRAEGYPDYNVHPAGAREAYAPIRFVEPFAGANLSAFGYDMYAEPVRRAALQQARDSADAVLSGKVTLIQDAQQSTQRAGTLLYVPVYRHGMHATNPAQRAAALQGYAFAAFRMGDLMANVFGPDFDDIDIEIFDGANVTPEALLFDTDTTLRAFAQNYPASTFRDERQIRIANRIWTLKFHARPHYLTSASGNAPALALGGGSAISLLLFGLAWTQATMRTRAQNLAQEMTAALRESEARFEGIIRGAAEAIIMTDAQQHIVLFNAAAEAMFRCSAQEAIGAPLERFIPQRYRAAHREHVEQFGHTGVSTRSMGANLKLFALRTGGEEFPIDASISRIEQDGKRYFAVLLRDITVRLEAETRIRRSEERLAEAQSVARIGSYELSLRPRSDYYWSAELLRITGLSELPEDWSSPAYAAQIVHPEDRSRLLQEFRRMLKARDKFDIEYRIVRPDGEIRWVHDLAKPNLGADGKIDKLIGTVQDITERKAAQAETLAANQFNQEIMSSVNEGIIVYDRELRAVGWNPFMESLTGLPRDQVLGKQIYEIFPRLREYPVHHALQRALGGESIVSSEPVGRIRGSNEFLPYGSRTRASEDPRIAWTITSWSPHRDQQGAIAGVITIVLDVTQLKRSQDRLQQSNERLRQLSAHLESTREAERTRIAREIHDELAGTLTGIKIDLSTATELAAALPALRERLEKSKQLIDDAVRATRRIINDLRPSILDNLGVWPAIEWVANDIAQRANLDCTVAIDASLADLELAPPAATALFRIVQESLTNVWRHAEATRVTVRGRREEDKVIVEIIDDGKGADDADLAKAGHWGVMGMHERAKSHGGEVKLESAIGRGTTVRVELPTG